MNYAWDAIFKLGWTFLLISGAEKFGFCSMSRKNTEIWHDSLKKCIILSPCLNSNNWNSLVYNLWKEMYKVTFLGLKIKLKCINNKNFKPDDSDEDDDNSNS